MHLFKSVFTFALFAFFVGNRAFSQTPTPKENCTQPASDSLQVIQKNIADYELKLKEEKAKLAKLKPSKKTSKGFTFTEVSDPKGFKDDTTGIIWLSKVSLATHEDAIAFCTNLGGEVPSKSDYKVAESHGIREIYLPAAEGQWASTKYQGANETFKYDGSFGFHVDRDAEAVVRCIKKVSEKP
jgi:hypothetical protein